MLQTLRKVFSDALDEFCELEHDNVLGTVSEQNWCFRIGIYLDRAMRDHHLNGYFVDAEYNRKQNGRVKTTVVDGARAVRIRPDLIVHSRGMARPDNLIAIEMKKANRPQHEKQANHDRLRALTTPWASVDDTWIFAEHPEHVCDYIVGYYVEIDTRSGGVLVREYRTGEVSSETRRPLI